MSEDCFSEVLPIPDDANVDEPIQEKPQKPEKTELPKRERRKQEKRASMLEYASHPGFTKAESIILLKTAAGALVALWFADTIIVNIGWTPSAVFSPLFETLKFVLSTMVGFLFAKQGQDK